MIVNLLDQQRQKRLHEIHAQRGILRFLLSSFVIMLVAEGGLLGIGYYLSRRLEQAKEQLSSARVVTPGGETLPLNETIEALNKRVRLMKPLTAEPTPEDVLTEIASAIPDGVTLDAVTITAGTKDVSIRGLAAKRSDIPVVQQALESIPLLTNVTTKSNLNERADVSFETSATLNAAGVKP